MNASKMRLLIGQNNLHGLDEWIDTELLAQMVANGSYTAAFSIPRLQSDLPMMVSIKQFTAAMQARGFFATVEYPDRPMADGYVTITIPPGAE